MTRAAVDQVYASLSHQSKEAQSSLQATNGETYLRQSLMEINVARRLQSAHEGFQMEFLMQQQKIPRIKIEPQRKLKTA